MSIALKGLITGLATGFGERIDEERKQTRQAVANRTKNAYENYLKYQEQSAALRDEVKKRDAALLQFQDPNNPLTDEERIALATMPNALELYDQALKSGRDISLRDLARVSDKAKGMKFDDFIRTIGQPQEAAQTQMAFEQPKSFFGTPVEKQQKMFQQLAGTTGVAPETLAAFQQPREAPSLTPMGTINMEMLKKAERTKTPKERQDMFDSAYYDAANKYGEDDERTKAFKLQAEQERTRQKLFNPDEIKWDDRVNKAKLDRADALDTFGPNSKEFAQKTKYLEDLLGSVKKEDVPSEGTQLRLFREGVQTAIATKYGTTKGLAYVQEEKTDSLGNRVIVSKPVWTGDPQDPVFIEMRRVAADTIKNIYINGGLSDSSGKPVSDSVKRSLLVFGISFDANGKPIFDGSSALEARPSSGAKQAAPTPTAAAQPAAQPPVAASAAQAGQTRTRAQVEAVAASSGISYEEAKAAAERQGLRVIE